MRHSRLYYALLDAVGLLALVMMALYAMAPDSLSPWPGIKDLWPNVAAEIFGIWLAVRFIDVLIKKRERYFGARIHTVRNLRFLVRTARDARKNAELDILEVLDKELVWAKGMLKRRRKLFSRDELRDIESFYSAADELSAMVREYVTSKQVAGLHLVPQCAGDELKEKMDQICGKINGLDLLRERAEAIILEETPEE